MLSTLVDYEGQIILLLDAEHGPDTLEIIKKEIQGVHKDVGALGLTLGLGIKKRLFANCRYCF